ncbi:kelch-like protein 12 [Gigantopelta aegis]|uniref:kelch-like protein 12 n=1 Tax=Gigantopelta aegis TaxID=1735272 RepID=UPI001B88B91D|nr:kelch-like protein 12 [Gigantopelta aegis]XP_041348811.1 kelch-like protein 12 [Gigantopelta aegis]
MPMTGEMQVFTDSHAKSILMTMNNLRKSETLCDVQLRVENQSFAAHRIVLAACSDYFFAMFTNEMSEKSQSVIELHDISANVIKVLLDFVYTETVNVSVENVQELLPAACLLQLTGVKQACCEFLEKQLDCSNCLGIKIFAENHSCDVLWQAAESYSLRHFEDVVDEEEFKSLSLQEVMRLMGSDELQVKSEEQVFEAVIGWTKHEEESRRECLTKLLECVRLPLLSARYITDVVDNEPLVKQSHRCRDLLDEAKKFHLRPDLRIHMDGPRMKPRTGTVELLVVLGGFGCHQNLVDAVEKFDPNTDEWSRLPNLTRRRRYVTAASLYGKLYAIGGYDGQLRLNTVECLDLTLDKPTWHSVAQMNDRRGLACSCVYQGHIYVCGGFDGYTRHTSMEKYNPKTDDWSVLTGMSVEREGAGLVVTKDMIFCIGGYDGNNLLDSGEQYNPCTEVWSSIACMSTRRSGAGVAVHNNDIYVCGGYDGMEHLATAEYYSTRTGHWTSIQSMAVPRCYIGACVLRGRLLVVAGYDGHTLLNSTEEYSPLTGLWELVDNKMGTPRCDAGITVVRML